MSGSDLICRRKRHSDSKAAHDGLLSSAANLQGCSHTCQHAHLLHACINTYTDIKYMQRKAMVMYMHLHVYIHAHVYMRTSTCLCICIHNMHTALRHAIHLVAPYTSLPWFALHILISLIPTWYVAYADVHDQYRSVEPSSLPRASPL